MNALTPIVDSRFNAWLNWGPDPLLAEILGLGSFSQFYLTALFLIFLSGTFALIQVRAGSRSVFDALFQSLAFFLAINAVALKSIVIWGTLAWIPWLATSFLVLAERRQPLWMIFSIFFTFRLAQSGLYLAPVGFLISIGLSRCMLPAQSFWSSRPLLIGITLGAALIAWRMFLLPGISALDYPPGATLVPDDGIPGIIRPLIGFDSPFESIELESVRSAFLLPSLIIFAAAVTLLFQHRTLGLLAMAFAFLGIADLVLPRGLALIAPLAALSRLLPGAFLYPLHPFLLALVIGLIISTPATLKTRWTAGFLALVLTLAAHQTAQPPRPGDAWEEQILHSPSHFLLKKFGVEQLHELYRHKDSPMSNLKAVLHSIRASGNQQLIPALTDDNFRSRWVASPKPGQRDWLLLEFLPETKIKVISLMTGAFRSDFPRGIEVRGHFECPMSDDFSAGRVLMNFEDWPGDIRFTPSGLPYLGGQENLTVAMNAPYRCISLERRGASSQFDWSVAELQGS